MENNKTVVKRLTQKETALIEAFRETYNNLKDTEVVIKEKVSYIYPKLAGERVLVIGDVHAPFDLKGYLDHCKEVYDTFGCNKVVFIGDLIDNHFSSYHDTDPNGYGAGEELRCAKDRIKEYYKVFPEATVIIGNHDRMAFRKAFSGGVPKEWIRDYSEVLNTPTWNFVVDKVIDNVLYIHGEGGTAKSKVKTEEMSVCQGHLHTQCYVEWFFSRNGSKFAMQVGTGIDFEQYAFAYAKAGKQPSLACGVVLGGVHAFNVTM